MKNKIMSVQPVRWRLIDEIAAAVIAFCLGFMLGGIIL